MIKKYQSRANIILVVGFVIVMIGGKAGQGTIPTPAAALIILLGLGVWVAGCHQYCIGKAQPGWKAIYGIVFPLGLIALALLPDQGNEKPTAGRQKKKSSRRRRSFDEYENE
ncbi:MAG: hypothetical protein O2983_09035 [Planctomycetota bacterium]|nr:hypothetical protein [Planctomycetota bacterium]MDA0919739.1 hypothetical protein [Planctomycetota bacterium]MDA1159740.1 hypothetical protein [Planctomycetota bacterium]